MTTVVTGGLGFIGSHLAERLIALGEEVVIVDDGSGNVVDEVTGAAHQLRNVESWCARTTLVGVDLIVHCAAPVGPGLVATRGGSIARDIIDATTALAGDCAFAGIPLVNISSSEVYGVQSWDPVDEENAYSELAPIGMRPPYTARKEYGMAKATAELVVANTPGLRSANVRLFNTVGPRQASSKGFVLPTFIEQAIAGEPLTLYEPAAERALTSVHDVVDFLVTFGRRILDTRTPWNVGNEANVTTMLDLAMRVLHVHAEHTGKGGTVMQVDPTLVWGKEYAHFLDGGGSKVPVSTPARSIGWNPTRSLDDIVREAYAAYSDPGKEGAS